MRGVFQDGGVGAERRQRGLGILDELRQPRPRACDCRGDRPRSPCRGRRPCRRPCRGWRYRPRRRADRRRSGRPGRSPGRSGSRRRAWPSVRCREWRRRCSRISGSRRSSSPAASARPSRPAACRSCRSGLRRRDRASGRRPCRRVRRRGRARSPARSARLASGWVSGRAQHVEGEGQQPVTGEDRGRLVEFLVRGRTAAAEIVVVHGRQVVMHQRIAMHAARSRRRPSARAGACTPNSAAVSTVRNGRSRLPPPRLV